MWDSKVNWLGAKTISGLIGKNGLSKGEKRFVFGGLAVVVCGLQVSDPSVWVLMLCHWSFLAKSIVNF
jgi:hypothetical protein